MRFLAPAISRRHCASSPVRLDETIVQPPGEKRIAENLFYAGNSIIAGVETAIAQYWTLKVEYLHVDLGSRQTFNVVPSVPETVSFTADILRVGLNYKFGYIPSYTRVVTK